MDHWILSLIVFVPAVGALALAFFPKDNEALLKWAALGISIVAFICSLHLPLSGSFHYGEGFQFVINVPWISHPAINYHLGVDGISFWLVLLTTFLVPFSIIIQWNSIHGSVKAFMILMLLLETAMLGVFVSLDLFLFYVFWEATLIPMALIIGVYGHERRIYAAVKFFLYTMVASVFMLGSIIWLYVHATDQTGQHTFDFVAIQQWLQHTHLSQYGAAGMFLFLGFFLAFAVKVPIFPFHTWLPDAHVEAPTAGSVLLAGVLLKMGTYGLLRFNLGLFPEQAKACATWINVLAIIGIIYGALVALVQPNMKKLIAYSSVSHLGFCVLGIFSFTQAGITGSIYQMLNHGISTGALFMLAGVLYDRRHTYEIKQYGGLASPMPKYALLFLLITLSSVGLPLMNGFVGEFLVLSGAFQAKMIYGILAASGVIWSAYYMLWLYQRTFYGEITVEVNRELPDVSLREQIAVWPMAVLAFIMGVASPYWMKAIDPAVKSALTTFNQAAAQTATTQTPKPALETVAASAGNENK